MNIREEALAIGKVPPEIVAKRLSGKMFKTEEDL